MIAEKPQIVLIGAGGVVRRFMRLVHDHPLRPKVRIIVAAPLFCRDVADEADVCVEIPGELEELRVHAAKSAAVYIGVPPDQTTWCLHELGPLGTLRVIEKPICRADQAEEMATFCGGSVRGVDHWLLDGALKRWPGQLERARCRFGRLLCVNIELGERARIDQFNQAAFVGAGGVWEEYGYHGWNLLRTKLLPGVEPVPMLFFRAMHTDAPPGVSTFGAAVALLDNVPKRLAYQDRVLAAVSAGKAMPSDQSRFSFIFERGVLYYHHRRGEIATCDMSGRRRVKVAELPTGYRTVLEGLAGGSPEIFQPLADSIETVRQMRSLAQSPIEIPTRYTAHPLPLWPLDGILAASAHPVARDWMRSVRLLTQTVIRRFLTPSRRVA